VPGFSFALNGYTWPYGTSIAMHLQLSSRPAVPLQDGSASWDASAADALAIWNQYLDTAQFVAAAPGQAVGGDGANAVFFASNVYGDRWPTGVLAVTLNYSDADSGVFTETDVIFNNNLKWNSYRGGVQGIGPTGTWDLHRVALHEFGHVLGLDHPDENGQHVTAIMNSIIANLDQLAGDDIAGAQALYGKTKLTAFLGADFHYPVTPVNAASYAATGLPPGLTIAPATGMIGGIATISGTYPVEVTVNKSTGSSKVILEITVTAPPSNPGGQLQKLDLIVNRLAADPSRSRVYATLPLTNSVAVIDTVSLAVIKTIQVGSNPVGLAVSADGSKLWVANSGSTTEAISVIDLTSLTALPAIGAPSTPSDVEEGLDHRLYVTPASQNGAASGIMQIDASTGAFQGRLGGFEVYMGGFLEISPDRKTLYFGNRGLSGSTAERFDVSTATASLLQQAGFNGGNGTDLKLSHAGNILVYPNGAGNGTPSHTTYEIPANDLRGMNGVFNTGPFPGPATFSGDDLVLYESVQSQGKVDIFNTATFGLTGTISWGSSSSGGYAQDIVVDNTGSRLFVATTPFPGSGDLRIFDTGRKNVGPSSTPAPHSLLNVSTRLRVQPGEGALIGGFIIAGSDTKTIVVRAIGPSLPLAGKLADPTLEIYDSAGALIAMDDNWNADRAHILNTGLAPRDEHEAALFVSLPSGAYTAIVRNVSGASGIGLVELYDMDSSHSRLANISTRGVVESGDNVMIGGFIVGGDQATKVIVRGIGPSLTANGIVNALPDPVLELHDGNGALITENDDWRSLQEDAINQTRIAPKDDHESAILATLQPGAYTAIVRGKENDSGVGVVEVYNLDAN
jgi:YVTN family beta-propeller protein